MAIIEMYLLDSEGSFDLRHSETTLKWLVYSDTIDDYAQKIAIQGITNGPMIVNGQAMGWYYPGRPYKVGNDLDNDSYAGPIEVSHRKIIRGRGDFSIQNLNIVKKYNDKPMVQWNVQQTYSTKNDQKPEAETSENDKFTVSVSYEWEDEVFAVDMVTGRAVVNSAGHPFNPPATKRVKIPVIALTRMEYGNPVAKAITYSNTIDGEYLIDSIVPQFDGKAWTVTYNIKIHPRGTWVTYIMDTGVYQRVPYYGDISCLNEDGTPVNDPVRLNGNGQQVPFNSTFVWNLGPFYKWSFAPGGIKALKIPDPRSIVTIPNH